LGIEGAKGAAIDLITLWVSEKIINNETVPVESESYFSRVDIPDAAQSA